jgi:predicted PurR-regulated permease PerM
LKRIVWYTTLVLITLTGLILFWQFRGALVLFLLSLAMSSAFHPLIDYLTERKIPRNVALIVSYAIVLAVFAGLLWIMSGPLVRDFEQLSNQIAISYERNHASWLENGTPSQQTLAGLIPPPEEIFVRIGDEEGIRFFQGLMDITTNLIGFFGGLGLVIILSLYWSADRLHFERLLLSLIAVEQRAQVRMAWRGIDKGVGAYFRSELIQSLLAGFLLWFGYRLIGLDYPVLLAVLGALAWLIPWFGAVIAMIPPFLVGLSADPTLGIIAALYTLLVLVVQEYIIEPRIFRRKSYSSVILVLVILMLTEAFGLIGLLLAPLLSATIQNIFKYLVNPPITLDASDQTSGSPIVATATLRKRLEQTKGALGDDDRSASPKMVSLVERLDHLIVEAELYFASDSPDTQVSAGPP